MIIPASEAKKIANQYRNQEPARQLKAIEEAIDWAANKGRDYVDLGEYIWEDNLKLLRKLGYTVHEIKYAVYRIHW